MPDETPRVQRVAAGACIALAFAALTALTWGGWTDPQIDFGNELYIAWQLSEGEQLYADIAHRNGPLSHTVNALLFRVFGVSLGTLVWANLAVLAACCALAFALLRRFAGVLGASAAVLTFLCVFAFGQYVDVANYNFVTPYHHFQTHGVALGLLELLALLRALEGGRTGFALLAGVCFGGLLLTKLELWVPGLFAACGGVTLWFRERRSAAPRLALAFAAGTATLPLLFLLWLGRSMPWAVALDGVLGNLGHLASVGGDAFYRAGAGLDAPLRGTLRIAGASLALAGAAGAILALDRLAVTRALPPALRIAIGLLAAVALWRAVPASVWFASAGALPVVAVGCAIFAARRCASAPDPSDSAAAAALLVWSLWAAGLLGKLLLAPRFHHYGFALAMPATCLLVAAWIAGLPRLATRLGGSGGLAQALAVGTIAAAVAGMLGTSLARFDHKSLWIGPAGDALRVESAQRAPRGERIGQLYARLAELVPPDATLLVYPEGALLNYWLRRPSPSRFVFFLPTELDAFGREAVLADLRRSAPDFVVLAHRGHADFGVGPFGEDPRNGRGIVAWVRAEYDLIERIGSPPFRARGFGAEIWRRRSVQPTPALEDGL